MSSFVCPPPCLQTGCHTSLPWPCPGSPGPLLLSGDADPSSRNQSSSSHLLAPFMSAVCMLLMRDESS